MKKDFRDGKLSTSEQIFAMGSVKRGLQADVQMLKDYVQSHGRDIPTEHLAALQKFIAEQDDASFGKSNSVKAA